MADLTYDDFELPISTLPSDSDLLMDDAVPRRKMFSSIPVGEAQYTNDNRGVGMQEIKALAKAAKKNNGLVKTVPNTPRQPQ